MQIKDRLYVVIMLDGKPIPLELMGLQSIQIHTSLNASLPSASIRLVDTVGLFKNQFTLADGLPVAIALGKTQTTANVYNFILFSWRAQIVQGVRHYTFNLILANYLYFYESTTQSIRGTSYDALSQIANASNLDFIGDTTADTQVWVPSNSRWCQFARKIAASGYVDTSSCMVLGVELDGTLKYLNYSGVTYDGSKAPKFIDGIIGDESTQWQVMGYKQLATPGTSNMLGGYASTTVPQGLISGSGSVQTTINTKQMSDALNQNADVKGTIAKGRLNVLPVDCGNVHATYTQAIHQNSRIKLLQSTGMLVAVYGASPINLMTPVNLLLFDHSFNTGTTPNMEASGYYLVFAKTIFINSAAQYFEKYSLVRDGTNLNAGNLNLVGS